MYRLRHRPRGGLWLRKGAYDRYKRSAQSRELKKQAMELTVLYSKVRVDIGVHGTVVALVANALKE